MPNKVDAFGCMHETITLLNAMVSSRPKQALDGHVLVVNDPPAIQQATEVHSMEAAELDTLLDDVEEAYRQDQDRGQFEAVAELDIGT